MTYALIRQFFDEESLLAQRACIMGYAELERLIFDNEMIELKCGEKPLRERKFFRDFLDSLKKGDTVVIDRIEILGRKMEEVIVVINCLLSRDVSLHIASSRLKVNKETGLAEILPLIVRLKEDSGETVRSTRVGRPKGRRSASKFDAFLPEVLAGLKANKSVSSIARELGVSRSSLKDYIESRNLKQILDDSWIERAKERFLNEAVSANSEMSCTLEEEK